MFSDFYTYVQRHLLIFTGFVLLLIGTTVYFIFNEETPVDASYDLIQINENIEKGFEADTVVFELSFSRTNQDEQRLYNSVLTQTNQILDVLESASVLPVEYNISRELTEPSDGSPDFSMKQIIRVESSTIASAKNVYGKINNIKSVEMTLLQYGFADVRPYIYQLKNEAFELLQSSAPEKISIRNKELVELNAVDGVKDIESFNPAPLYLEDPAKKIPHFPNNSLAEDGTPSFDARMQLSESVSAEYITKEKSPR